MQTDFMSHITAIALAIVGVATLALLVSKNANTVNVIGATSSAFTNALGVALSPVTGGQSGPFGSSVNTMAAFPIS